jgi:energy-coupling factor transport system ATP-binding protein
LVVLDFTEVGYQYPTATHHALSGVSLNVAAGEIVVVTGPSGCGKSTLLGVGSGLLPAHGGGVVSGRVTVQGEDPSGLPPAARVRLLGVVDQRPEDQIITGTVGDEVAFAPVSAGLAPAAARDAGQRALAEVGLGLDADRSTGALSGGERQRLVVAAALAAGAECLVLDEPLAHLDPAGAAALVASLRRLADHGTAILLVEHRLPAVEAAADRIVVLDDGRVAYEGDRVPDALGARLGLARDGLQLLRQGLAARGLALAEVRIPAVAPTPPGEVLAALDGASWRWPGASTDAVTGVELALRRGERVALVGPNGSGKTSLLRLLRARGVRRGARCVAVPQDPDLALFAPTVRRELAHGPREAGLRGSALDERVARAAEATDVARWLDRPPQSLSRGQRLRVAVAAALACAPDVLLLDEPTVGQDRAHVLELIAAIDAAGVGLLVVATHDLELAFGRSTRVLRLRAGRIVGDGTPLVRLADEADEALTPLLRWCRDAGVAPDLPDRLAGRAEVG